MVWAWFSNQVLNVSKMKNKLKSSDSKTRNFTLSEYICIRRAILIQQKKSGLREKKTCHINLKSVSVCEISVTVIIVFVKMRSGLLLVFMEICPDKVILDHKKSYLVYSENFHFFQF